jgi:hypothetical protein
VSELLPKAKVPEKVAAIVPDVSATVADTLVKEIPLTLTVPLETVALQVFVSVYVPTRARVDEPIVMEEFKLTEPTVPLLTATDTDVAPTLTLPMVRLDREPLAVQLLTSLELALTETALVPSIMVPERENAMVPDVDAILSAAFVNVACPKLSVGSAPEVVALTDQVFGPL